MTLHDDDNVIDFTKFREEKETPVKALSEWIKESIERADKLAEERKTLALRKEHNDRVIEKLKKGKDKGKGA